MRKEVYAMMFQATITTQSGKERTVRKTVYADRFINTRFFVQDNRIQKAIKLLESQNYRNIEYLETNTTSLLIV